MSNPFDAFKQHFPGSHVTEEPPPPNRIVLPCKTCHRDIARSDLPSHQWVHLDDEVRISTNDSRITNSLYDHPAGPDVLDCEGWEDDD